MTGIPVTIVNSGGIPVTNVESGATPAQAVDAGGVPVTLANSGGLPLVIAGASSGGGGSGTLTGVSFTTARGGIDEAPQGVRFIATPVGTAPADEVMYVWDFGDDYQFRYLPAGKQASDRQSGTALGRQAVHAYQAAGTYTVTCTAYIIASGAIASASTSQQVVIAASDPRITERVAISLTGGFTGAPAGATQVDWSGGVPATYALEANKAYYLEAGQTFTMDRLDVDLDLGGCVKLTKYGAGANPIIAAPGTSDHFASLWFRGTDQDDFTVSEVDFLGTFDVDDDPDWENTAVYPTPPPNPGTGIYVSHGDNGGTQSGLFFGVKMSGFGINFYNNNASANSEIYCVDCESTNYFDYGVLAGVGVEAFVGVHSTQKIGTQGFPVESRTWNTAGQLNTASHGPMRLSSGDPLILNKCYLLSYRSGWSGSPSPGVAATQAALRTHTADANANEQMFLSQCDVIGGFGIMSNTVESVATAQGAVGSYIIECNYFAPNSDGDTGGYITTSKPGSHYRGNVFAWPSGITPATWVGTLFLVSGLTPTSFASGGTVQIYGNTLASDENMPTVDWQAADQIDDPARPITYANNVFQINGTFDSAGSDALFQTDYSPLAGTFPFAPQSGSAAFQGYSSGLLPPLEQDGTPRVAPFSIGASEEPAAAAPVNTVAPTISPSGAQNTGTVLTTTDGTWTGSPAPTYTYEWLRNGTPISGATSSTYTLVVADEGTTITSRVTGTNASGSASATSSNSVTGQASAATPSTIMGANSISWIDPSAGGMFQDAGTTPAANGDPVQQIPDQEGGTYEAFASANRPVYRVETGVHYLDMADNSLLDRLETLAAGTDFYMIAAIRRRANATGGFDKIFIGALNTTDTWSGADVSMGVPPFSGTPRVEGVSDNDSQFNFNAAVTNDTWEVVEVIISATDVTASVDGVEQTGTFTARPAVVVNSLNIGSYKTGSTVSTEGMDGEIAALAFANAVPTAQQRIDMRAWATGLIS